jgi:hypothetical protein
MLKVLWIGFAIGFAACGSASAFGRTASAASTLGRTTSFKPVGPPIGYTTGTGLIHNPLNQSDGTVYTFKPKPNLHSAINQTRIETLPAGVPTGHLRGPVQNGFSVGWLSRELDTAHVLARRMRTASNPAEVLARDPGVTALIKLPGEADFLVQFRGSDRWHRFANEAAPNRELPKGSHLPAADHSGAKRNLHVTAMERSELNELLGSHRHLIIREFRNGKPMLSEQESRALDRQLASELGVNIGIRSEKGMEPAIRHLDDLIQHYGPQPALTLRRGVLQIEANRLAEAAASIPAPSRPLRGRESFFEEINERLANQGLAANTRSNLYRYAKHVDFQDAVLRRGDPGDLVFPIVRGNAIESGIWLGKMPDSTKTTPVDPAKLRSGQAVIYRQDSPGLNNLDWSMSPDRTLQQITDGRLARIVRLPRGDIAHSRPSIIFSDGVALHKVHPLESQATNAYRGCDSLIGLCRDQTSDDREKPEVYLVIAD